MIKAVFLPSPSPWCSLLFSSPESCTLHTVKREGVSCTHSQNKQANCAVTTLERSRCCSYRCWKGPSCTYEQGERSPCLIVRPVKCPSPQAERSLHSGHVLWKEANINISTCCHL